MRLDVVYRKLPVVLRCTEPLMSFNAVFGCSFEAYLSVYDTFDRYSARVTRRRSARSGWRTDLGLWAYGHRAVHCASCLAGSSLADAAAVPAGVYSYAGRL